MLRRLFEFVYAPGAALILLLLLPPLCLAVIVAPTLGLRREIGRLGVRLVLGAIGVTIRVRGLALLPATPCIVVANHASYFDGLVLTAALPRRFTFVVQDGAAGWPFVGLTIRRMGVVFVNRSEARAGARTTRALMRRLKQGESLALFAEGTFRAEPGLMAFKAGAFLIAARTGVPLLPAAIRGTRRLYGGGRRLPRWSRVDVELGAPIFATGTERADALVLRDRARAIVLQLSGEPDRMHHHGPPPGAATDAAPPAPAP